MNSMPYMYTNGAKGADERVRVICCVQGCGQLGPIGKDLGEASVLAQGDSPAWRRLHRDHAYHLCPMHAQFFTMLISGVLEQLSRSQVMP